LAIANAPSRGGSISHFAALPSATRSSAVTSNRLRATKLSSRPAVERRRLAGTLEQRRAAFDAEDAGGAGRQRQGEIARPQNQSITNSSAAGASRRSARETSASLIW
jgi:hypothetical protein